jgi:hypothetical protein
MVHLDELLALSTNIRLGCKGLTETNTLAYVKSFIKLGPVRKLQKNEVSRIRPQGPYSQHFILFVTYEWAQYARMFVPVLPF